ncbi:MAG: hypothetical protein EOM90_11435 [Alphaproteobacteria bacterium]|nr:hypothetical protein [Alphaproteobacteria bacterium]
MARQEINLGIVPGDKRGDKLRVGGRKINENFTELYNILTNAQASPVIAGKHVITEDESNRLAEIRVIIPSPGVGKFIDLISLIVRITPSAPPTGGLQVNPDQTLNVTTDGDTETRDWGFFPSLFLMTQSMQIQRMTPVFSTQLFTNTPVYVCLSGGENPKSGCAQMELFFLYRIIDPAASGGTPSGSNATLQVVQSFVNQSEIAIQHDLQKYPTVVVMDTTGRELISEITHESTDRMMIRLNPAASGKIIYS